MKTRKISPRGIKRQREEQYGGERAVLSRFTASLYCPSVNPVCKNTIGGDFKVEDSVSPCYCVDGEEQTSHPVTSWLDHWPVSTHTMGDIFSSFLRQSGAQQRTDTVGLNPYNAASLLHHQVEVDVVRGDTGRHYCFTVCVPRWELLSLARGEDAKNKRCRDAVVLELLEQLRREIALAVERPWVVIFHGKSLQTESGAELLLSSLLSESCQRISLCIFCNSGAY